MTVKEYLMISTITNIVENTCLWDGDTSTWQPPADTLMLLQATTPAMLWNGVKVDGIIVDWVLEENIGLASIGFTWDGTVCTTNEPKPAIPTV